jgi:hypothetical protein
MSSKDLTGKRERPDQDEDKKEVAVGPIPIGPPKPPQKKRMLSVFFFFFESQQGYLNCFTISNLFF